MFDVGQRQESMTPHVASLMRWEGAARPAAGKLHGETTRCEEIRA